MTIIVQMAINLSLEVGFRSLFCCSVGFDKELHSFVDDLLARRLYIRSNASPVVARILNDHDVDGSLELVGSFFHVVRMLGRNRSVFVTLNHQQRWTVFG